jgi:hypothetical protein
MLCRTGQDGDCAFPAVLERRLLAPRTCNYLGRGTECASCAEPVSVRDLQRGGIRTSSLSMGTVFGAKQTQAKNSTKEEDGVSCCKWRARAAKWPHMHTCAAHMVTCLASGASSWCGNCSTLAARYGPPVDASWPPRLISSVAPRGLNPCSNAHSQFNKALAGTQKNTRTASGFWLRQMGSHQVLAELVHHCARQFPQARLA